MKPRSPAGALVLALLSVAVRAEPRIQDGRLDLRGYDFERQGPIPLEGTWRFERGAGCALPAVDAGTLAGGYWARGDSLGIGRYAVRVVTDEPIALGLSGGYLMTSARVCAGGVAVATLGRPGPTRETTVPAKGALLALLPPGRELDLVLEVANHHTVFGGIPIPLQLGTAEQALAASRNTLALGFLVLGALLIIGLYNLVISFFRRDAHAPLFLGVFCLCVATRQYVLEHQALHQPSEALFEWWMRLEYASIPGAGALMLAFVAAAFPTMVARRVIDVGLAVGAASAGVVLVTSPLRFSSWLTGLQLVALGLGVLVLVVVVRAALGRRVRAAQLSLAGFVLLFFALLKDVLQAQGLAVDGRFYVAPGMLAFVLCQALVVAFQNAEARRATDQLNRELVHQIGQRSLSLFQELARLSNPVEGPALQAGAVVNGRYRVVGHVASGGMGAVYEVVRLSDGLRLALKVGLGLDLPSIARLAREAHFMASVEHPNVVRVFDVAIAAEGFLFVVMEFVEGRPLEALMTTRLPAPRALELLRQTAAGLAALHAQGIIHRDLKPSNVLVGHAGPAAELVKLTDFGISFGAIPADNLQRLADLTAETARGTGPPPSVGTSPSDALTRDDRIVGTTAFMAPEQLRGRDGLSSAVDVFAFGVVAWQLLTGARPWSTPAIMQVASGALSPPPSLLERCPELDPAEARLLEACLSEDPQRRPLARQLEALGTRSSRS